MPDLKTSLGSRQYCFTVCNVRCACKGLPASSRSKVDLKVGDDSPQQRLYKRHRQAHDCRWNDKCPSWEEVVVSLLEVHREPLNLQGSTMSGQYT